MKDDKQDAYECLDIVTLEWNEQMKIPGNQKCHMISHF